MSAILLAAWGFSVVSFCVAGIAFRVACRRRRGRGQDCICGRHVAEKTRLRSAPASLSAAFGGGSARLRAAESRVRALQQRYVEGRLSMEQYESEVDRAVGLA